MSKKHPNKKMAKKPHRIIGMPMLQRLYFQRNTIQYDENGIPTKVRGGILKRGSENRRIVAVGTANGREYKLHATKGYRSYRA